MKGDVGAAKAKKRTARDVQRRPHLPLVTGGLTAWRRTSGPPQRPGRFCVPVPVLGWNCTVPANLSW
jgi:hypothetical protein